MLITKDILLQVVPGAGKKAEALALLINELCPKYGINNADILHEFIAQTAHESMSFQCRNENLNYTSQGLLKVFKKYFSTQTAAQYAHKPQMIANKVYANRLGNRDVKSGDGYKFRGGGFIQLTGADIWNAYAKYIGKSLEETITLVRTTDRYALDSACWVFSIEKKLNPLAVDDLFLTITKRINGGTNGINDRTAIYNRAKKYIV